MGSALQRQQAFALPPLEQWYFGLLKDGRVPGALVNNNPLSKKISCRGHGSHHLKGWL